MSKLVVLGYGFMIYSIIILILGFIMARFAIALDQDTTSSNFDKIGIFARCSISVFYFTFIPYSILQLILCFIL